MDFEFTDDQQALRLAARAMLANECPISLVREVVETGRSPDLLWAAMVELSWPALTISETLGGLGLGYIELTAVLEELGRVLAPGPFLSTVTQFVPAVREAGTQAQQRRFLPLVANGTIRGTLAITERDSRREPGTTQTFARRDGDGWILEGKKEFVFDGASADEIVVVARVEEGIGLFVVPQSDVVATPMRAVDASQQMATVELTGVRVEADRALGIPGQSRAALERALEEATTAVAISNVGTCDRILEKTVQYAKLRTQFDVPIGSFQAVKHKLTDMYVALEEARALAYFAALTIAEDDDRRSLATAMAKASAGECQRLLVQDGLQLHGAIGYTWEYDLHLFLKRAKSGDAQFGTARMHRYTISQFLGNGFSASPASPIGDFEFGVSAQRAANDLTESS